MTMEELRAHLSSRYRDVQGFGPDLLRLSVGEGSEELGVGVHRADPWAGRTWIAMSIKVCTSESLQPRGAMLANTQLPVGGIAIFKDWAVVRQTLPIDNLDPQTIDAAIDGLATIARRLKAAVTSPEDDLGYVFR